MIVRCSKHHSMQSSCHHSPSSSSVLLALVRGLAARAITAEARLRAAGLHALCAATVLLPAARSIAVCMLAVAARARWQSEQGVSSP